MAKKVRSDKLCQVCRKTETNRIHYFDEAEILLLDIGDEEDQKLLARKHPFVPPTKAES